MTIQGEKLRSERFSSFAVVVALTTLSAGSGLGYEDLNAESDAGISVLLVQM